MERKDEIYVSCPNCGSFVAKTFVGPETTTKCPKCKKMLRYEIRTIKPDVGFYKRIDITTNGTVCSTQI